MAHAKRTNPRNAKIGDDLRIAKTTRRATYGGTWVLGTIAGHEFSALVFPEHAECPEYELGQSRISKLWLERMADNTVVVNFDRGWDRRPANATAAKIVDFLAANLADLIYNI